MFKKFFLLTNPISGSILENSSKWYHISTRGINHTRRWFHKRSSTLSDHQVKQVPSSTRTQVYQVNDPCYNIGGGAPPIGIKVKDPPWVISRAIVVSFQQKVVSIKNEDSSVSHLPQCNPLHQWEAHLLWKLMTKGERLYKDRKAFIRGRDKVCKGRDKIWKLKRLDMNMDKEGATLEKWDGSKFLDKRSTQVGGASSWTLIGCIWYVHSHVLACIA